MRLCSGCGTKLLDSHRGKCAECRADARPSDDGIRSHESLSVPSRDKYAALYRTPQWTNCSKIQRRQFPFCERCEFEWATICDHVVPAVVFVGWCQARNKFVIPTAAFFWRGNHQSLCAGCHAIKTQEDALHLASGEPWADLWEHPIRPAKKRGL